MSQTFEMLCSPFSIGGVTLRNRFVMAPVTTGSYLGEHGEFSPDGIDYFARRAEGGFGLLLSGALTCDSQVDTAQTLGPSIAAGENAPYVIAAGRELNQRLAPLGTKMFLQLTMGLGRNYPGLYAPSALPVYGAPGQVSPALTTEQVHAKIDAVVAGARVAQEAGFAGVEVHAMHWGYLLDQFAMSLTNRRSDEYGGSLENRLRAAGQIVAGIKRDCGSDFPVMMRLGLKSYVRDFGQASFDGTGERGRTLEEGVRIARMLESLGYDALDVDTGTYDSFYWACPPSYVPRGYMAQLASAAKRAVGIPVICGSRMNSPALDEQGIEDGSFDAVALGRPAIADPDLPRKVEQGMPERIRPCLGCNQGCFERVVGEGKPAGCTVNAEMGHAASYQATKADAPRRVVVLGGGVAGMEAARVAALRGHEVVLLERRGELGGHLIAGARLEQKRELGELNAWYQCEIERLGVDVRLGTDASAADVAALAAEKGVVVLATGSRSVLPAALPGHERAITCVEALMNPERVGERVVVVGDGFVGGADVALQCARHGKKVSLVQELPELFLGWLGVPTPNRQYLADALDHYGVRVLLGCEGVEVVEGGVDVAAPEKLHLPADTVIAAETFEPLPSMGEALEQAGLEVYEVGDGAQVGNILTAVERAYAVAREL